MNRVVRNEMPKIETYYQAESTKKISPANPLPSTTVITNQRVSNVLERPVETIGFRSSRVATPYLGTATSLGGTVTETKTYTPVNSVLNLVNSTLGGPTVNPSYAPINQAIGTSLNREPTNYVTNVGSIESRY